LIFIIIVAANIITGTLIMPPPPAQRQSRIPNTLQAVFLASNRGREVHKPPPEKVAYKVYFRNWLFQRQSDSQGKSGLFGGDRLRTRSKNLKTKQQAEQIKQQSLSNTVAKQSQQPVAVSSPTVVNANAGSALTSVSSTTAGGALKVRYKNLSLGRYVVSLFSLPYETPRILILFSLFLFWLPHDVPASIAPTIESNTITARVFRCHDPCQGIFDSTIQNITIGVLQQTLGITTIIV
jgi:hypothetical protein